MVCKRRSWRSDSGAALIEMAVLTPVLLLLALGIGDFGRVMYTGIVLSHAARAGAQYGLQSTNKAADLAGVTTAAREEAANIGAIGVTAQMICECLTAAAVNCVTTSCPGYGTAGGPGTVRVFTQVTTTFTFRTLVDYPLIPDTVVLSRVAKVRMQ